MRGWLGKISGCMSHPQQLLQSSVADGGDIVDFSCRDTSAAARLPGDVRGASLRLSTTASAVGIFETRGQWRKMNRRRDDSSGLRALVTLLSFITAICGSALAAAR